MIEPLRTHEAPGAPAKPAIEEQPIPWFTMILLGGLLFLVGHRLDYVAAVDWSTTFGTTADAIAEGQPRRRLGYFLLGLWGVVSIIAVKPQYKLRLSGFTPWLAVGFLLWAPMTLLWAEDFSLVSRRLVILGMVTVATVAALRQFSLRQVVLFTALSSLAYALIGLAAELAYGVFQPLSPEYRFAGTQHPNHQGMNLARLILGAFCLSKMKIAGRRLFVVIAVVALVLLVLTRSRSAFGATLIALGVFWGLHTSPLRLMAVVLSAGAVGILALFLIQNESLSTPWQFILMGRGSGIREALTLSGRTELWQYLWTFVGERPLLGYGYNSFMSPERAAQMPASLPWGASGTHSLYLEILLGTGAIGFGLLMGTLVGCLGRAVRWTSRVRSPAHAFLVAYIVFIIVNGVMGATTMAPDPKFVAWLTLGYVLLRDPQRGPAGTHLVADPRSGRLQAAAHGPVRPGVSGEPAGPFPPHWRG
jgi:O-antigen ligase